MGTTSAPKNKKEKVYHPKSRKAGQLVRKSIRTGKMNGQASSRNKKNHDKVDFFSFFHDSLPEDGVFTLGELHAIVGDVWLTRFDQDIEQEQAARRPGRPKNLKQTKMEEIRLREAEQYRAGFEVIDLTHEPTVALFRKWDRKQVAYLDLLRCIRISSTDPSVASISRPGKHRSIITGTTAEELDDTNMDAAEDDDAGLPGL